MENFGTFVKAAEGIASIVKSFTPRVIYRTDPTLLAKINNLEKMKESERKKFEEQVEESLKKFNLLQKESKAMKENFSKQVNTFKVKNKALEDNIVRLEKKMQEAKEEKKKLLAELQKPIVARKKRVDFVNNLNLKIKRTENILLAGPKGSGKSTFLWLLGKGSKPKKSHADGTTEFISTSGFTDSIGISWTRDNILKLYTLFLYDGFPRDIIVFSNDRYIHPITYLNEYYLNSPMIVISQDGFWRRFNKGKIPLRVNEKGCKIFEDKDDLDEFYDFEAYEQIKSINYAKPVTHLDDIGIISKFRSEYIDTIGNICSKLGNTFTVKEDPFANLDGLNEFKEQLFRFVYIYEKLYKKDKLKFMNNAQFSDFMKCE